MAKTNAKYKAPKGLIDRVFFLFADLSYEKIGELFGLSKGTIGGWRTGNSVPKLSELETICKICRVNWDWLMTGYTDNVEALTYAYFPVFYDKNVILNQMFYDEARVASEAYIDCDEYIDIDGDENSVDYDELRQRIIMATASLMWAAQDSKAPDPMVDHVPVMSGEYKIENSNARYCTLDYLYATIPEGTPKGILESTRSKLKKMRNHYSVKTAQKPSRYITELTAEHEKRQKQDGSLFHELSDPPAMPTNDVYELSSMANFELPVIGNAAADNDQASRAEFYDDGDYETVQIAKEHYRLIRVHGDSMEPVILDGQFVLIGSEIRKNEKIRKQGIICVCQIDCTNDEFPEEIGGCSGGVCTFVKRIFDAGKDMLMLTSINASACSPFTVMRHNVMHIWPIKGVIFANHGNIPED